MVNGIFARGGVGWSSCGQWESCGMLGFSLCVTLCLVSQSVLKNSLGQCWYLVLPAPFGTSCCFAVRGALVTSPECHTLIQPSNYKGVGCCSVTSCYSVGTNRDEMWCFVPQLLFEDLTAAISLIRHPPSSQQVPTYLFILFFHGSHMIWALFPEMLPLCTPS